MLSPKAGGYDAIWLLVCDPPSCAPDQSPLERIEHLWAHYEKLDVSPLSAQESMAKGVRVEALDDVPGLKNAVSVS